MNPILIALKEEAKACYKCDIANKRTQVVFGDGLNLDTVPYLLIGEAAGQEEDRKGKPFVGKSGELMTKILENSQLYRGQNYAITNVLQCRPINNATPTPEQISNCSHFLYTKITQLKPKILILIGGTAANAILKTESPISQLRGKVYNTTIGDHSCKAIPTYHPSFLLRNEGKFPVEQFISDIELAKKTLSEITIP